VIFVYAVAVEDNSARKTYQVCDYKNKNTSRSREALCVSRVPLIRLLLPRHKFLTESPGGSCGHGHVEVNRIHIRQYSMPVKAMSQEEETLFMVFLL
jgi:hypothetical protein